MISFCIEPILGNPLYFDEEQQVVIGYRGVLTIRLQGIAINYSLGGYDKTISMCVEQAQAILNGISIECRDFEESLGKKYINKK